jgi:DNA-binding NtrC family response regulator
VGKGLFREDLFYRLNVIEIALPTLQERGDDTLLLAHHFAKKFSKEMGKKEPLFTGKALELLRHYAWPGNVRELENVIHRLVVMSDSIRIDAPDLPSLMRYSGQRDTGLSRTLADVEAEHIRNVLASVGGNKTRAAEILGIDRKTLRQKLNKLDPA